MFKQILFISGLLLSIEVKAQDPHFSQYHASPLTLNPALTGYVKGDSRFTANFRQQWQSVGQPYVTGTASFDTKLMPVRMKNDIFGFGLLGLYDQSSGGAFKNSNISASLSYLKALNEKQSSHLGIGFQLTYASRFINTNKLNFASQFTGFGFDTGLPSNENFGSLQREYFDLNTGLLYTYKSEKLELDLGGSMYHITKPNISFLKNETFDLPQRFTVHTNVKFFVGNSKNELNIGGLFMQQAGADEKNIGVSYGIKVDTTTMITGGISYRFNDAVIPYMGLNYKNIGIGISYDINNSDLKNYTSKNGSFEVSLLVMKVKKVKK